MRHIFILIVIFLVPLICFNQVAEEINRINIDSLNEVIPELKGIERIDAQNKIALTLSIENHDSCISLAGKAIVMSEELAYQKGMADGYFNLGNMYYIKDSLKPCVLNYLRALRIYEQLPPSKWMAITLGNLASINWYIGRTDKAIEYQKRQFQTVKQLEVPPVALWGSLITIAYYFDGIGIYDSVFHYCDMAFELAEIHNDTSILAYTYTNLFRFKLHQARVDPSRQEMLDECISIGSKAFEFRNQLGMDLQGRTVWTMFMYTHFATAYLEKGTDSAVNIGLDYLNKVKSIYDTIDFRYSNIINVYSLYGNQKARSGDFEHAISYYEKGVEEYYNKFTWTGLEYLYGKILWVFLDKNILKSVYDSLYRNYERIGNLRKALDYNILSNEIENEIFIEEQMNMVAMLEADSEIDMIEKQVDLLERDKQIRDLQVTQSRNISIGIAALFMIFILLGVFYVRQVKLKNEYKSSILEQKLLRLQMNPHFIFNALSSIHNLVIKNNNDKASAYLVNFSQLLRTSLESSREDFILLEDEIRIIQSYLELQRLRHHENFDFSIDVDYKIDPGSAIIPPMLIQPFVENAIEHGIKQKQDRGHVRVSFTLQEKMMICEIDDDGIGRGQAVKSGYELGKKKSLATQIISERIKALNKKLRRKINLDIIDKVSETGETLGTLVRLNLPYLLD